MVSTLGWAWWFHHLDRFERQPFTVVLACFLWGGLAAPFAIAIAGNCALGSLYSKVGGAVWGANWSAGLSAPFVEESAKAAGFILILGLAPRLVRTPADGIFLGAFIGLGFQTFEDFLYAVAGATGSFGSDQVGAVTGGIAIRAFSDIVSHPMFSALVCADSSTSSAPRPSHDEWDEGLLLVGAGVGVHLVLDSLAVIGADTGKSRRSCSCSASSRWAWACSGTPSASLTTANASLPATSYDPRSQGGAQRRRLEALTGHQQRRAYLKASPNRRERRKRRHVLSAALDLCADLADARAQTPPTSSPHAPKSPASEAEQQSPLQNR